jgi:deoxyribonuclease IV
MHGHVIALGDQDAFAVEDRAGIIAALFYVWRERRTAQAHTHLFCYGGVERFEDLEFDRVDSHRAGEFTTEPLNDARDDLSRRARWCLAAPSFVCGKQESLLYNRAGMSTRNALIIGMHASIAGGLANAISRAEALGCDCLQIFARNPRGWAARNLTPSEINEFRDARDRSGLWPLVIHSVYLINLAAQDPVLLAKSRAAFREEIERGLALGADYLVVHPGNPGQAGAERGIVTAVESIREATRGLKINGAALGPGARNSLTILIENTAGQGSSIGCDFEQIAELLAALDDLPVDVCLDTAHTFASGYDISSEAGLATTIGEINRSFGIDRIKVIHCNDSRAPLGSRVDRHEHIGLGHIGADAFRRLSHNLKFSRLPFILETPVDVERGYERNIARLRELGS